MCTVNFIDSSSSSSEESSDSSDDDDALLLQTANYLFNLKITIIYFLNQLLFTKKNAIKNLIPFLY